MGKNKSFIGPKGKQKLVTEVLKTYHVAEYTASVCEENRDTGYPGLAVNVTVVRLDVDKKTLKKVADTLTALGFSEEK